MAAEIISWPISTKLWDWARIKLATPGSAVRHVTDCATRPSSIRVNLNSRTRLIQEALFVLILYIPAVNDFSVMSGWVFMGWTSTKQRIKCLAHGHNTVTLVSLETSSPSIKSNILPLSHCTSHKFRTLVKSVYRKNSFLISQPKLMLWVLKRTVSMRRFFWAHKTYVKTNW